MSPPARLATLRDQALIWFDGRQSPLPAGSIASAFVPGTSQAAVLLDTGGIAVLQGETFIVTDRLDFPQGFYRPEIAAHGNAIAALVQRNLSIRRHERHGPASPWDVLGRSHRSQRNFGIMISETGRACGLHYTIGNPEERFDWGVEAIRVFEADGTEFERVLSLRETTVDIGWLEAGPILLNVTNTDTTAEWLDAARDCAWEVVVDGALQHASLSNCGSVLATVMEDGRLWVADRRTKRITRLAKNVFGAHARTPNRIQWLDHRMRVHEHVVLPGIPAELEALVDGDANERKVLEDWALEHGSPTVARALSQYRKRPR
ncbi:MAG: hypothetical protein AAGA48_00540 [Myxococcota bacterium]